MYLGLSCPRYIHWDLSLADCFNTFLRKHWLSVCHSGCRIFNQLWRIFHVEPAWELVKRILRRIHTQAIQWCTVVRGVAQHLQENPQCGIQIPTFGGRFSLKISLRLWERFWDWRCPLRSEECTCTANATSADSVDFGQNADSRYSIHPKIVIVGMSCRMPGGGSDTNKFWQLLEQGPHVHRRPHTAALSMQQVSLMHFFLNVSPRRILHEFRVPRKERFFSRHQTVPVISPFLEKMSSLTTRQ